VGGGRWETEGEGQAGRGGQDGGGRRQPVIATRRGTGTGRAARSCLRHSINISAWPIYDSIHLKQQPHPSSGPTAVSSDSSIGVAAATVRACGGQARRRGGHRGVKTCRDDPDTLYRLSWAEEQSHHPTQRATQTPTVGHSPWPALAGTSRWRAALGSAAGRGAGPPAGCCCPTRMPGQRPGSALPRWLP
jgi:hypothetical protein